jgi:hypothetical protein
MEKRQEPYHDVVLPQFENVVDRVDVRADVAVRKHHSLRFACCAGSENYGQHIVGLDAGQREPPVEQGHWNKPSGDCRDEFVLPGNLVLEVFQVNQIGIQLEGESLDKPPARQHVTDMALGDRVMNGIRRRCVIQIDRDTADQRQRRIGHNGPNRWWQQHADVLFVLVQHMAKQQPTQDQRPRQQTGAGQFRPGGISDFRPPQVPAAHAQETPRKNTF